MHNTQVFRVIHFNDVYDIEPGDKDPIGGVARFKTAIDTHRTDNTLVLFSGDGFSPSFLSETYKGQQTIVPLNSFGIDVACLGNHDLDFGQQQSLKLQRKTNFPWVLSNFFYKGTTNRLLDCKEYVILQKFGLKIGIFGLAQKQCYHGNLDYVDFVQYGSLMVETLRKDQGCNFIIALTHMMGYNDTKLAKSVKGIDLILGGHDHTIRSQQVAEVPVIKSGTNFKHFSIVSIHKQKGKYPFHNQTYGVNVILIHISEDIIPDSTLDQHVKQYIKDIQEERNKIAFICDSDLDLRFEKIRKQQCPFLRLIAQWYAFSVSCDFALANSGNQRNNAIYPKGSIIRKHIFNINIDEVVCKKLTGQQVVGLLQNSVSMYPNLSGRFGNFAGIQFQWNPAQSQGNRVLIQSIKIKQKPFNIQNQYIVVCHHFQSVGGDGYSDMRSVKQFVFKPDPPILNTTIVTNFLNPQCKQTEQFCNFNSSFYYIVNNQYGVKQIHFDPTKIPSKSKMI